MALPTKIQLHIVSADRSLVDETVDEVEIPGADGHFGVLPGHTPLLALLGAGELWYRQGAERVYVSIAFGSFFTMPLRKGPNTRLATPNWAAPPSAMAIFSALASGTPVVPLGGKLATNSPYIGLSPAKLL